MSYDNIPEAETRSKILALSFAIVAACLLGFGTWAILTDLAALSSGAAEIRMDAAVAAAPLFGIALAALALLLALPAKASRHPRTARAAFAGFLIAGLAAIGAIVGSGPLSRWVMQSSGYRACAVQRGIRGEQVRWVRADRPCDSRSTSQL